VSSGVPLVFGEVGTAFLVECVAPFLTLFGHVEQHGGIACLKAALNADCDGQAGLQELAGNATMLFYMTEEGQEGRNAFNEKRRPDFSKYKRNP
jgi:hypothetical protein